MPLFAKGVSVEHFGGSLNSAMGQATNARSLAQLLAEPATYFYNPQVQPAPSASELTEEAYKLALGLENFLAMAVPALKQAKPEDRRLRPLYDSATTLIENLSRSLGEHNVAIFLLKFKGDSRKANRHAGAGKRYETVALKEIERFIANLYSLQDKELDLYLRLGLDETRIEEFVDVFPSWNSYHKQYSIWEA
jgi:hypothetical protein